MLDRARKFITEQKQALLSPQPVSAKKKRIASRKLHHRATAKDYAANDELNLTTNEYGQFMNNTITEGQEVRRLIAGDSFKSDGTRLKANNTTVNIDLDNSEAPLESDAIPVNKSMVRPSLKEDLFGQTSPEKPTIKHQDTANFKKHKKSKAQPNSPNFAGG